MDTNTQTPQAPTLTCSDCCNFSRALSRCNAVKIDGIPVSVSEDMLACPQFKPGVAPTQIPVDFQEPAQRGDATPEVRFEESFDSAAKSIASMVVAVANTLHPSAPDQLLQRIEALLRDYNVSVQSPQQTQTL